MIIGLLLVALGVIAIALPIATSIAVGLVVLSTIWQRRADRAALRTAPRPAATRA